MQAHHTCLTPAMADCPKGDLAPAMNARREPRAAMPRAPEPSSPSHPVTTVPRAGEKHVCCRVLEARTGQLHARTHAARGGKERRCGGKGARVPRACACAGGTPFRFFDFLSCKGLNLYKLYLEDRQPEMQGATSGPGLEPEPRSCFAARHSACAAACRCAACGQAPRRGACPQTAQRHDAEPARRQRSGTRQRAEPAFCVVCGAHAPLLCGVWSTRSATERVASLLDLPRSPRHAHARA